MGIHLAQVGISMITGETKLLAPSRSQAPDAIKQSQVLKNPLAGDTNGACMVQT